MPARNDYIEKLERPRFPREREEALALAEEFESRTIKGDGVVRWRANNSIPPQDILEFWVHVGKKFDIDRCKEVRQAEEAKFLAAYARMDRARTIGDEEMFELRANHPPGTTIVNVASGRKIKL